ncbi:MAG TPA: hypothetical protein VIH29_01460 [Gallionella sp.]
MQQSFADFFFAVLYGREMLAVSAGRLNNAPRAQTPGSLIPILAAMLGGGYGD